MSLVNKEFNAFYLPTHTVSYNNKSRNLRMSPAHFCEFHCRKQAGKVLFKKETALNKRDLLPPPQALFRENLRAVCGW